MPFMSIHVICLINSVFIMPLVDCERKDEPDGNSTFRFLLFSRRSSAATAFMGAESRLKFLFKVYNLRSPLFCDAANKGVLPAAENMQNALPFPGINIPL